MSAVKGELSRYMRKALAFGGTGDTSISSVSRFGAAQTPRRNFGYLHVVGLRVQGTGDRADGVFGIEPIDFLRAIWKEQLNFGSSRVGSLATAQSSTGLAGRASCLWALSYIKHAFGSCHFPATVMYSVDCHPQLAQISGPFLWCHITGSCFILPSHPSDTWTTCWQMHQPWLQHEYFNYKGR